MKRKITLKLFAVSFLMLFTALSGFTQYDDPNKDQIPFYLRNAVNPSIHTPMAVITIDDYDNFDMGVDYSEGHVSIHPSKPLWIFNAWNINATHWTINGHDWFVNNPAFPNAAGDPVTAYDSLGNLYYETMKSPVTGTWIAKSTNNGQNWIFTNVSGVNGNDKNWIACDQTGGPYANYIYTVMTPGNFARSTDYGATFTQTATFSTQTLPGMMVAVGPNGDIQGGCVYVVTHSGANSAGTYTFYKSTNGGANFSQVSALSVTGYIGTEVSGRSTVNGMRTRPYPMIAADNSYGPNRGRLYLVYATNDPAGNGNKPDIFLQYSTNQGANWSSRVKVNDDVNTQNNHQFFPAIWCDKYTGRLYIKWYDTRNCPTSDSMDVYATYTDDGGLTFAPNQRITNRIFKTKLSSSGSAPAYQGDYDAINSVGGSSVVLWADFRNNNYGSYCAYFPDFAMKLSPTSDSLNSNSGNVYIKMEVPSVKLYTDTVIVSATVTPTPATGTITVSYPSGNKLSSYPGFVMIKVSATGGVTPGTYTLNVQSNGPQGIPVHKRTALLYVDPTVTGISSETEITGKYELFQNFPNPFNPVTKIDYFLAKTSNVSISVYDALGRQVASMNYPNQMPGKHSAFFNAANLSAGVYFYKLSAGDFSDVKKMMLVK